MIHSRISHVRRIISDKVIVRYFSPDLKDLWHAIPIDNPLTHKRIQKGLRILGAAVCVYPVKLCFCSPNLVPINCKANHRCYLCHFNRSFLNNLKSQHKLVLTLRLTYYTLTSEITVNYRVFKLHKIRLFT